MQPDMNKRLRMAVAFILIISIFTFIETSYLFYLVVKAQIALYDALNSFRS